MKKVASLVVAALIVCSFAGCQNKNSTTRSNQNTQQNIGMNQGTNKGASQGANKGSGQGTSKSGAPITNDYQTQNYGTSIGRNVGINQDYNITTLRDGTYTAAGDKTTYGTELATLTVRGGRIVEVILTRVDRAGRTISYNNTSTTQSGTTGDLKQSMDALVRAVIDRQTYDVNVTSPTSDTNGSINNWKLAIHRAIDKAKGQNNSRTSPGSGAR